MICKQIIRESGRDGVYTRRCSRQAGREGFCTQHLKNYLREMDLRIGAELRRRNFTTWERYRKMLGNGEVA